MRYHGNRVWATELQKELKYALHPFLSATLTHPAYLFSELLWHSSEWLGGIFTWSDISEWLWTAASLKMQMSFIISKVFIHSQKRQMINVIFFIVLYFICTTYVSLWQGLSSCSLLPVVYLTHDLYLITLWNRSSLAVMFQRSALKWTLSCFIYEERPVTLCNKGQFVQII